MSGSPALQIIEKQLEDFYAHSVPRVSMFMPDETDDYRYVITLVGPVDSYYEDIIVKVSILFSSNYPKEKPEVKLITPLFHPNVNLTSHVERNGKKLYHVCMDILNNWMPTNTFSDIIFSLVTLLVDPNYDSSYYKFTSEERKDKKLMKQKIIQYTYDIEFL
jgi:ubiquitin-protein ligase